MAVSKARYSEPLKMQSVAVIQKALIVGGGLAGMVTASSLANQGFEVYLVEKEKELGGNLRKIYYTLEVSDVQKMGYTVDKYDWVLANESFIWKYFVENKLLYSTDTKLYTRFIANAPFSKFYIDIDKESPGSVGVWLGWQIVRSYMKNNNVTLQHLLQTNSEEIFKRSKYKPRK